jgi:pimeloyl-ACP methyl ester carboxylesterase
MPLAAKLAPAHDVFFDLPGHGRSAPWAGTDYHSDATAVAAALLHGPTHIIGHSFGATVALRLAVERPDLVSRVTLIEPVMFAAAGGARGRFVGPPARYSDGTDSSDPCRRLDNRTRHSRRSCAFG